MIKDEDVTGPAIKFVQGYIAALNKSFQNPSAESDAPSFASSNCKSCRALQANTSKLEEAKVRVKGELITFTPGDVAVSDERGQIRVFGTFKQNRVPLVDKKGGVQEYSEPGKGS